MRLTDFGMDTITLAGPLEAKLRVMRESGFTQVMLAARDIVGHPEGEAAAIRAVKESGLRVTGFQVLRDFEGLSGHLHDYKIDIAKAMLRMCKALDSPLLLICSSTSPRASSEIDATVRDLQKLATLAIPLGIKIAYEALSWGRHVNEYPQSWEIVDRADKPNLGICIDSFHVLATSSSLEDLSLIDTRKVFLVQLSDFMWHGLDSPDERRETARHFRVFPGEGVHNDACVEIVQTLDRQGYQGDYSFEVFNDDFVQLPLPWVCERAMKSVNWIVDRMPRSRLPIRRHIVAEREFV